MKTLITINLLILIALPIQLLKSKESKQYTCIFGNTHYVFRAHTLEEAYMRAEGFHEGAAIQDSIGINCEVND